MYLLVKVWMLTLYSDVGYGVDDGVDAGYSAFGKNERVEPVC